MKIRHNGDLHIMDHLNNIIEEQFMKYRENIRKEAKKNIIKIQQEIHKQYNL